ncbi:MAG: YceD family protein [Pseudoprimorskyibacter sp.]|nr:YceD family protein [Pseudoprimorskyibacter sp.]
MTSSTVPHLADFRVADLPTRRPTHFDWTPDQDTRAAFAQELGLSALRKLRFFGQIVAEGKNGWLLDAKLGATVVQPCVSTLERVTTRIDTPVLRRFLPQDTDGIEGTEVEMPEDENIDILGDIISPAAVLLEALALAIPDYPRVAGAEPAELQHSAPGIRAMQDADARPFAKLAAFRDKLSDPPKSS